LAHAIESCPRCSQGGQGRESRIIFAISRRTLAIILELAQIFACFALIGQLRRTIPMKAPSVSYAGFISFQPVPSGIFTAFDCILRGGAERAFSLS
jgi:hypothetical protein